MRRNKLLTLPDGPTLAPRNMDLRVPRGDRRDINPLFAEIEAIPWIVLLRRMEKPEFGLYASPAVVEGKFVRRYHDTLARMRKRKDVKSPIGLRIAQIPQLIKNNRVGDMLIDHDMCHVLYNVHVDAYPSDRHDEYDVVTEFTWARFIADSICLLYNALVDYPLQLYGELNENQMRYELADAACALFGVTNRSEDISNRNAVADYVLAVFAESMLDGPVPISKYLSMDSACTTALGAIITNASAGVSDKDEIEKWMPLLIFLMIATGTLMPDDDRASIEHAITLVGAALHALRPQFVTHPPGMLNMPRLAGAAPVAIKGRV